MSTPEPVATFKLGVDGAMDRKIAKRRQTWRPVAACVVALGVAGALGYQFVQASSVRSFTVSADVLTVSAVHTGQFLDFVPVRGTVTPLNSVYLDAIEGGRVDAVLVEEGSFVAAGQPILELSNTALQLDVISREAQVSEQLNNLRNTRLAIEQNRLSLRGVLLEVDYQVDRLTRLAERRKELFERNLISRQDYEDAASELEYNLNRRKITIESQQADERMRLDQIHSLESTVEQLERNLEIARRNLDNLVIKAPVAGQLTSLSAELGQSKTRGERLGQIDDVDDFKIVAQVDEFYVTRLQSGQVAEFELAAQTYKLEVLKVYPEIRDGQFQIDLKFVEEPPRNLRRGQTLQIRLALGDASQALLLARGGFFEDTGGNWAFVLDLSGEYAEKRDVRLGRRNPEYFEVLGGLSEGDRVITSAYSSFTNMDRIELKR